MSQTYERVGNGRTVWVTMLAVLVAVLFVTSSGAEAFRNVEMDQKAPGFSLKATDGSQIAYSAPTEAPVVIAFVRQGQDKSAAVLKDFGKLPAEVADKAILVAIVVNPEEGDPKAWAGDAKFPIMLDEDSKVYSTYGVVVAPQVAVLAPDGALKHEFSGHTSAFVGDLEVALREMLGMEVETDAIKGAEVNIAPERKKAMREMQKAQLFIQRKMSKKAIPQVRAAVESDPTYVEAQLLLGQLLLDEEGDIEGAKAVFTKAAELDPKELMAKVGLARVQAKSGDYEGAVADLEKAALISPKAGPLYYYLGIMHEDAKNFEKAAKAYRKAVEKMMDEH